MSETIQTRASLPTDTIVNMETSHGMIAIRLFPEIAPKACENFLTLAEQGYYDGIIFHRVIKDFMIQGGDPTGTGMGGKSAFGKEFEDEFSSEVSHIRGALSMANAGPNTNGSQFFIVHAAATPWLDGAHTVFGQVIDGMDTVDDIAHERTDRDDRPLGEVKIVHITRAQ